MPLPELFRRLRDSIDMKDFTEFRKAHFDIVNVCRVNIFEVNKGPLAEIYPLLSDAVTRFYMTGRAEWTEADRYMGGLDALRGLIGNLLATDTQEEALAKIQGNPVEKAIIQALANDHRTFADLAAHANKKSDEIDDAIISLNKKGLIIIQSKDNHPAVSLTPKGKLLSQLLHNS